MDDTKLADPSQINPNARYSVNYKDIVSRYGADLAAVEKAIGDHFQSDVALIPDVSSYLISGGGKRIRPLLVIASARLCGYTTGTRHIDYSVVVEYIHAATLLHDDVVDEADLRRGSESPNMKYGNQASVLVGDFLFAKSFQIMSEGDDMRIVRSVSSATRNLAEGEVLQLVNTCNLETSEDTYMDTIFRKTGALIVSCMEIGAILGGAPPEKEKTLSEYGKKIGIAFQLMDDALDYTADEARWGKPVGADLEEGKVTLPLIRAWKLANDHERRIIRDAFEHDDGADEYIGQVREIMERYEALSYTVDLATRYAGEAKEKLSGFSPSPHLDALAGIADYIVNRDV